MEAWPDLPPWIPPRLLLYNVEEVIETKSGIGSVRANIGDQAQLVGHRWGEVRYDSIRSDERRGALTGHKSTCILVLIHTWASVKKKSYSIVVDLQHYAIM